MDKVKMFKIEKEPWFLRNGMRTKSYLGYCVVFTNATDKAIFKMVKGDNNIEEVKRTIDGVEFTFIHKTNIVPQLSELSVKSKTDQALNLTNSVLITKRDGDKFVSISQGETNIIKKHLDLFGENCLMID